MRALPTTILIDDSIGSSPPYSAHLGPVTTVRERNRYQRS